MERFIIKRFEALLSDEVYEMLKMRQNVFILEQACLYADIDGKDQYAYHVFLKKDEETQAYLRIVDKGVSFDAVAIGRVLTLKRGMGYGDRVLRRAIKFIQEELKEDKIEIEAQTYAKAFYERCGFSVCSPPFLEDGIEHVRMIWTKAEG